MGYTHCAAYDEIWACVHGESAMDAGGVAVGACWDGGDGGRACGWGGPSCQRWQTGVVYTDVSYDWEEARVMRVLLFY